MTRDWGAADRLAAARNLADEAAFINRALVMHDLWSAVRCRAVGLHQLAERFELVAMEHATDARDLRATARDLRRSL